MQIPDARSCSGRFDHVIPSLIQLHWLSATEWSLNSATLCTPSATVADDVSDGNSSLCQRQHTTLQASVILHLINRLLSTTHFPTTFVPWLILPSSENCWNYTILALPLTLVYCYQYLVHRHWLYTHRCSTQCPKNRHYFALLSCYNFDVHQLILIIFGRNVAKKVSSQMVLYFPTSPN